jgi:hypothetical protein
MSRIAERTRTAIRESAQRLGSAGRWTAVPGPWFVMLFNGRVLGVRCMSFGHFERLGITAESWRDGMGKLRGERLLGRIFVASRIKLRAIAKQLGVRHLVNLTGCPLR